MKLIRIFILSCGVILLITAISKFVGAFGSQGILRETEPITGITIKNIFLISGWLEMLIAVSCLFNNMDKLNAQLLAWLSIVLAFYRIGLHLIGWSSPCRCLGGLMDVLQISSQTADTTMKVILAYLLLGSFATLFWLWWQRKKASRLPVE